MLARECNMLLCDSCGGHFFPEVPFIYYEPAREFLAFVFPESFRERELFWRDKMHEDFLKFKESFGKAVSLDLEPELFFGPEGLAVLLEQEDYKGEEREVMEFLAKELGLGLYQVSPGFARKYGIPTTLPFHPPQRAPELEGVLEGLRRLVEANDRLVSFKSVMDDLGKDGAVLPPSSKVAQPS